jgi:histidyl-tRNA synthetase
MGSEEQKTGTLKLKNIATREQIEVAKTELITKLQS